MNKSKVQVFISIAALCALTLACNAVSGFVATETPIPTNTPLPTNTPPPTENTGTILTDDFSDSGSGWGTGTDSESSVEYANGGLQFIVYSDLYITWSNPTSETFENIHVDVTAKNDSSDRLAVYGIICHEQLDQTFYYLGVASDGYYTIAKAIVGQDDEILTDGNSSLIPTGSESFDIGADCGNGTLTLYVNGQQVASAQDSTYTSGTVALFAWSNDTPNAVDVTFDDFVLSSLQ